MVKLTSNLGDFSEPEEKEQYTIKSVESVDKEKTKGYIGIVVQFEPTEPTPDTEKIDYRTTAWYGNTDIVGSKSKLGAFISAFSNFFGEQTNDADEAVAMAQDTNNWLNHTIKIISWREKKREITVES